MMRRFVVSLTALPVCLLACAGQSPKAGNTGKALLDAYVSAWNRHDFGALDTLLAPDAVHEDIAANFQGKGPAQIKEFMGAVIKGEPDLNWRLTKVVAAAPLLAAEWTWQSTYTGDTPTGPVVGKRISGRGTSVMEVENGKIKRFTDYYDLASYFRPDSAGK